MNDHEKSKFRFIMVDQMAASALSIMATKLPIDIAFGKRYQEIELYSQKVV